MHADVFGLHPDGTGEPRKLGVLGLHLRWNGLVVLEWPIMAGGRAGGTRQDPVGWLHSGSGRGERWQIQVSPRRPCVCLAGM